MSAILTAAILGFCGGFMLSDALSRVLIKEQKILINVLLESLGVLPLSDEEKEPVPE